MRTPRARRCEMGGWAFGVEWPLLLLGLERLGNPIPDTPSETSEPDTLLALDDRTMLILGLGAALGGGLLCVSPLEARGWLLLTIMPEGRTTRYNTPSRDRRMATRSSNEDRTRAVLESSRRVLCWRV